MSGSCSLLMIDPVIVGAMAVCLVFSSPLGSDEICAQLSLLSLYLYSQISIWMCESAVCWRFSQSAANGSVRKSQRSRGPPHAQWGIYFTGYNELVSDRQVERDVLQGGRLWESGNPFWSLIWCWETSKRVCTIFLTVRLRRQVKMQIILK